MFAFRVNKERKNTEICTVDGFIIPGMPGEISLAGGFCADKKV